VTRIEFAGRVEAPNPALHLTPVASRCRRVHAADRGAGSHVINSDGQLLCKSLTRFVVVVGRSQLAHASDGMITGIRWWNAPIR
jgi:hypothetical protein